MVEVLPADVVQHGPFTVEVIQVNHSIPDGCAYAFRTPHGIVVHTGDFKLDQTPVDGRPTDLAHFARLGDEGVDLLLADSTNADVPGHVPTERVVGQSLREEMQRATGLVVVASFASHVHRIQQVLDAAAAVGRRPVFVGRSMVKNMDIARRLAYLDFDHDREVAIKDVPNHDPRELVIISTGSQGEPYSALSLMASGDHKHVEVGEGDTIILASSLIPGNEQAVFRSINGLARRGAHVVHKGVADVHVSGHANGGDLTLFHNIVEPEYVVPVHGEYRHMAAHRDIAIATGCPPEQVFVCEDGDVIELEDRVARRGELDLRPARCSSTGCCPTSARPCCATAPGWPATASACASSPSTRTRASRSATRSSSSTASCSRTSPPTCSRRPPRPSTSSSPRSSSTASPTCRPSSATSPRRWGATGSTRSAAAPSSCPSSSRSDGQPVGAGVRGAGSGSGSAGREIERVFCRRMRALSRKAADAVLSDRAPRKSSPGIR